MLPVIEDMEGIDGRDIGDLLPVAAGVGCECEPNGNWFAFCRGGNAIPVAALLTA